MSLHNMGYKKADGDSSYKIQIEVNKKSMVFEFDTGVAVCVISDTTFAQHFRKLQRTLFWGRIAG